MAALAAVSDELSTDDFVQEWPQSGERIRKEGSRKIAEQYADKTGNTPKMDVRGVRESGDLVVIEGTIDYGNGVPVSYVGIAEFEGGKVRRMTESCRPVRAPGMARAVRRADGRRGRRGVATGLIERADGRYAESRRIGSARLSGSGPRRRAAGRQ